MGEKKNIIMNLVELGKRNQKVTTKEINDALEEIGSMAACKEKGLVRSEGKDYVMKDGDIVLFRFNV